MVTISLVVTILAVVIVIVMLGLVLCKVVGKCRKKKSVTLQTDEPGQQNVVAVVCTCD